jgi:hypothetical protein
MKSPAWNWRGFDLAGNQAAPAGLGAGVNEHAALKEIALASLGFDTLMMIKDAFRSIMSSGST